MARTPLEQDLPCAECGYNLRGLTTADRCPECGTPVIDTTEAGAEPQESEHVAAARRAQATAVAEASGYRLSAVLFVSAVLSYTLRHLRSEAQEHVTAKDVCAGFAEYARLYFNDSAEALDLLSEWGLRSSEDVGRIIWAMVKAGLATSAEGDSPEDFAGVFTLDDIASASFWKPKANRNGGNEQRGSSR